MWVFVSLLFVLFVCLMCSTGTDIQPPHIIYILTDDMGWNDVSFHGSDQIPTPNIDALAYNGVILNRHYVLPVCTPSRASLMTGKYATHTGLHNALGPSHRTGLSLHEKILPQYLKDIGYSTHLVGKWHLGFYKTEFTPLQRGFDSHFGYWSGAISYYDHIDVDPFFVPPNKYSFSGHDMRRNYTTAWDTVGEYATDLFTREAVHLINTHSPEKPLFLYLAHLAVHAGNEGKWLEAPQEEINRFWYISNPNRRTYAAMVSKLDQSVGEIVDALDKKDMLKNSIIVILSDNGAPNEGVYKNWGSNYPWRGQKATLWEGGVRTPALVWSPLIENPSRVSYELMHITDWLPTLLTAAGCNQKLDVNIDGVSQWHELSRGYPSPREEVVVDIDEEKKMYALILNHYKYVQGAVSPRDAGKPEVSSFLNTDTIISPKQPEYELEEIYRSPAWQALQKYSRDSYLLNRIPELREAASVKCDHDFDKVVNCNVEPCLFNLQTDPCEQHNIANLFPSFVNHLQLLIDIYKSGSVPDVPLYLDLASNPEFFNGTWSSWVA